VSYTRQKKRILNDAEYREQVLQRRRDKKQKPIEDNPLHTNARKDADRMVKVRRVIREIQNVLDVQE